MAEQQESTRRLAEPLYIPADFFLLRAPALPAQIFLQLSSAGHVSPAKQDEALDEMLPRGEQECARALLKLAARPQIAQALTVASPSLQVGLERLRQGKGTKAQQRRVYAGLLRYLIRMSTRPTPFGLFAGVGLGTFAQTSEARLGPSAIAGLRTRPDMSWLLAMVRQLEEDPALVAQLQVQLNPTAYLVGERAVLPFANTYGEADSRMISLRATAVVRTVFDLARQWVPYAGLRTSVQSAFPHARAEQVDRLLWQLWQQRFLMSQLHPPLTDAMPTRYVRDHLQRLQGFDEIKTGLSQILATGEELDQAGIGASTSLMEQLVQQQRELLPAAAREQLSATEKERLPLQVDALLDVRAATLHPSIGQGAARAATFLLRQTPSIDGLPYLKEYRSRFQETYGEGAEVPLLDLLSPEHGLDAPIDYAYPRPVSYRPSHIQRQEQGVRDRALLTLVLEAVNSGSLEVELSEEDQRRLERCSPTVTQAPLSLEIYLHVHAASREALDRGAWSAVIGSNCGSPHGGRTFGRFFDLLGESGLQALHSLARREEAMMPEVIFAELSYQPWQARQANVAIRPPLRSYEIVVGTTPSVPPERVISLSDLVVGVRDGRFYVRSLRLGKQVRISQCHMLNIRLAPNVCRFLNEITNDGLPQLSVFDWGAAQQAPFLPRLVIREGEAGKLVLTPARWHLQQEMLCLQGAGSEQARWFRGVQEWRRRWMVPRYVYLTEMDNRLLLDLEHPLMVEELRDEVKKLPEHGRIALEELLPDFEHLWLRDAQDAGYFSEIVVPLLRADMSEETHQPEKPVMQIIQRNHLVMTAERRRFPGEDWVYMKAYAAPSQHEELIAGHLRQIVWALQEQQLIDRWFFIRYCDPEPHLRLRFHAKEGIAIQQIYELVLPWSVSLARQGLLQRTTLETYDREVERYGGPASIDLLEEVFTVDSQMVSNVIAAQYNRLVTLDPLALAVWTLEQFCADWGWQRRERLAWTQRLVSDKYTFRKAFRPERKRYCDLLAPSEQTSLELRGQRIHLLELLRPQANSLSQIGAQVRALFETGRLWITEDVLMRSLVHMHLNRLLGIDRVQEAQTYAFWRYALEALERRPERLQDRRDMMRWPGGVDSF